MQIRSSSSAAANASTSNQALSTEPFRLAGDYSFGTVRLAVEAVCFGVWHGVLAHDSPAAQERHQ